VPAAERQRAVEAEIRRGLRETQLPLDVDQGARPEGLGVDARERMVAREQEAAS
jgi:hypothetical protein